MLAWSRIKVRLIVDLVDIFEDKEELAGLLKPNDFMYTCRMLMLE